VRSTLEFDDNVDRVDKAGDISEKSEKNVDQQVNTAASLDRNADGRNDQRQADLAAVSGTRQWHLRC